MSAPPPVDESGAASPGACAPRAMAYQAPQAATETGAGGSDAEQDVAVAAAASRPDAPVPAPGSTGATCVTHTSNTSGVVGTAAPLPPRGPPLARLPSVDLAGLMNAGAEAHAAPVVRNTRGVLELCWPWPPSWSVVLHGTIGTVVCDLCSAVVSGVCHASTRKCRPRR